MSKVANRKGTTLPAGDALTIDTIEQLKAIADPLRQQLLQEFAREPATTKQVAVTLGLQPTRLYHHVAKLENCGLIKLVETRPVRGATEKYYEAVASYIKIDRDALPGKSAQLVGDAVSLNVIDGLWTNIRNDIAELLAEASKQDFRAEEEVIFVQAEIEVDEKTATRLRDKMMATLKEIDAEGSRRGAADGSSRKYRMVVGWYPRAAQ